MEFNIEQALDQLSNEFYSTSPKISAEYKSTPEPGSQLSPERLLSGQAAWQRLSVETSATQPTRKPILLADYRLKNLENNPSLYEIIQLLTANRFELHILTEKGSLQKLDYARRNDIDYLKTTLKAARVGRKAIDPKEETSLEFALRGNGKNPETWHIIDHYAMEQILHAAKIKDESDLMDSEDFSYTLSLTPDEIKSTIQKNLSQVMRMECLDQLLIRLYKNKIGAPDLEENLDIYLNGLFEKIDELSKNWYGNTIKKNQFPKIGLIFSNFYFTKSPNISNYPVKFLEFYFCTEMEEISEFPQTLQSLKIQSCCKLKKIDDLTGYPIQKIYLSNCLKLYKLPLLNEKNLEILYLNCKNLKPTDLSNYYNLKKLYISHQKWDDFPKIPEKLESLIIKYPSRIDPKKFSSIPKTIKYLSIEKIYPEHTKLPNLKSIIIEEIEKNNQLSLINCENVTIKYFKENDFLENIYIKNLILNASVEENIKFSFDKLPINLKSFKINTLYGEVEIDPEKVPKLNHLSLENTKLNFSAKKTKQILENLSILKTNTYNSKELDTLDMRLYPNLTLITPKLLKYTHPTPTLSSAPPAIAHNKTSDFSLDNQTYTDPNKTHTTHYAIYERSDSSHVLKKIDPSTYRQHIHNALLFDDSLKLSFTQIKIHEMDEKSTKMSNHIDDIKDKVKFTQSELHSLKSNQYFVDFTIQAGKNWIPLPGLTAQDKILEMYKPKDAEIRFNADRQQYEIQWKSTSESESFRLQYIAEKKSRQKDEKPLIAHFSDQLRERLEKLFIQKEIPSGVDPKFRELHETIQQLIKNKEKSDGVLEFCQTTLVDYFSDFANKPLKKMSGYSDLECILMQGTGACRHRASAYVALCQFFGVPARLITNEIHTFAEIYSDNSWQCVYGLGGAEARLEESEPKLPESTPQPRLDSSVTQKPEDLDSKNSKEKDETESLTDQESAEKLETKPLESPDSTDDSSTIPEVKKSDDSKEISKPKPSFAENNYCSDYLRKSQEKASQPTDSTEFFERCLTRSDESTKNPLLTIRNLESGRDVFAALKQHLGDNKDNSPVYYLESPEQLIEEWSTCQVNEKSGGIRTKLPSKLQQCIEGEGILVINWARFSPTQMAAHMSINDRVRMLKGKATNKKLRVFNLVTDANTTVAGDRFFSRCESVQWPTQDPQPKAYSAWSHTVDLLDDKKKSEDMESLATIDLYGDSTAWKQHLVGSLIANESGFQYQLGALGKALLEGKKGIVLVDPPQTNPEFMAFITRARLEGSVMINGKLISIPADFEWHLAPTPEVPDQPSVLQPQSPSTWQEKPESYDTFYLNNSTFSQLFRRQAIQNGIFATLPGWLDTPAKTGHTQQIVLTGPLSSGQQRRLYEALGQRDKDKASEIHWVDLTKTPEVKPSESKDSTLETETKKSALLSGALIETNDPFFVAHHHEIFQDKEVVRIPIHAHSSAGELLENIQLRSEETETDSEKKSLRFSQTNRTLTEALQSGKTVVLYGQLSPDLYHGLESLYGTQPQLTLASDPDKKPVTGKILFVTEPPAFDPNVTQALASHQKISEDGLQADYQSQLKKDFPEEKQEQAQAILKKILAFYESAKALPHGVYGTPPLVRLTYQRIQAVIKTALASDQDHAHPLKAFFHHDYQHDSETYAYLNVLAKLQFATKEDLEYKSSTSGTLGKVRREKLETYPDSAQHFWRRLNCLDTSALVAFLHGKSHQLPTFSNTTSKNYELQTWLTTKKTRLEDLPKNKDAQAKIQKRLQKHLDTHQIVTLKGDPGTGKTYAALHYAQQSGRQAFFGDKSIAAWLDSKAKSGEESVLIIDEANLVTSGTWDFLQPLMSATEKQPVDLIYQGKTYTIDSHHKVIFTGNPEHYPSRSYHGILQDSPQLYVGAWTADSVQKHVVDPLIQTVSDDKTFSTEEAKATLTQLLQAVVFTNHLMKTPTLTESDKFQAPAKSASITSEYVSIRDIQQLMMCWMDQLQSQPSSSSLSKTDYQQAAYEAMRTLWGNAFDSTEKARIFQQHLEKTFNPKEIELEQQDRHRILLSTIEKASKLTLNQTQNQWLIALNRHIDLSEQKRLLDKQDGATLVKLGTLLEGGSGVGKTTLAIALLEQRGLMKKSADELLSASGDSSIGAVDWSVHFIQFTPSSNPAKDREILLAAFDRGCKLVLDELNLDSTLEELLNQLLSGKTPEGKPPKQKGFYLIASQNESHHAGSQRSSSALKNRMTVIQANLKPQDLEVSAKKALSSLSLTDSEKTELAKKIVSDFVAVRKANPQKINTRNFFETLPEIVEKVKKQIAESTKVTTPPSVKSLTFFAPVSSDITAEIGGKQAKVDGSIINPTLQLITQAPIQDAKIKTHQEITPESIVASDSPTNITRIDLERQQTSATSLPLPEQQDDQIPGSTEKNQNSPFFKVINGVGLSALISAAISSVLWTSCHYSDTQLASRILTDQHAALNWHKGNHFKDLNLNTSIGTVLAIAMLILITVALIYCLRRLKNTCCVKESTDIKPR